MSYRMAAGRGCQWGTLACLLALLVWSPLAYGAVAAGQLQITTLLALCAVACWLVGCWLEPRRPVIWTPFCWVSLLLLALAAAGYLNADLEYVARHEVWRIGVYLLVFWLALQVGSRSETAQTLALVLIGVGFLVASYGIYQFATGSDRVWASIRPSQYAGRASGSFICPNHFAAFLELVIPVAISMAALSRLRLVLRLLLGYAGLVMLCGLAASLSRGGWLGCGVGLVLLTSWIVLRSEKRWVLLLILAIGVGLVIAFYQWSPKAQLRMLRPLDRDRPAEVNFRGSLWTATIEMWRDHVWFGVGPGHFDYRFPFYRPVVIQARPHRAHNDYLNTLADWGLAGGALLLGTLVVLCLDASRALRHALRSRADSTSRRGSKAAVLLGALAGLASVLVHSFVDFNFHIPAIALTATCYAALISGHLRFASDQYWHRPRTIGAITATLILGSVGGWTGWVAAQSRAEEIWLAQAGSAQSRIHRLRREIRGRSGSHEEIQQMILDLRSAENEALASWQRASLEEPANFDTAYAIGNLLRQKSWTGDPDYVRTAREAIPWFHRASGINPFDPSSLLGIALCLDWLGQNDEALPYYERALSLDPVNYYLLAHMGWHFVQTRELPRARIWFRQSLAVRRPYPNPIAQSYLRIIEKELARQPVSAKP